MIARFFYPPFCLCCRQQAEEGVLCRTCLSTLRLARPSDGQLRGNSLDGSAVCFDDGPVVRSLLAAPAELLSPFIVLQWNSLGWPLPDYVVPTPGDWFSRGSDRWHLRREVAASVASTLGRTSLHALAIRRHRLPTPYLSLEEQSVDLDASVLRLRHPRRLVNSSVLLIHDTLITGRALRTSASALCRGGARAVWALSIA